MAHDNPVIYRNADDEASSYPAGWTMTIAGCEPGVLDKDGGFTFVNAMRKNLIAEMVGQALRVMAPDGPITITWGAFGPTIIEKTVDGVEYAKYITYTGSEPTGVTAWGDVL